MIVSPKNPPVQVKFRWDPDLLEELKTLAEATNRTQNDTGERLMRWAIERAKAELQLLGEAPTKEQRRKKP